MILHIQMQVCDRTLKEWLNSRNYNIACDQGTCSEKIAKFVHCLRQFEKALILCILFENL